MDRDEQGQQQIVDLDRGLFWIRYQSADDTVSPPKVFVAAAPGHEDSVELILHPDVDEAILWQPGSALIARISHQARLHVAVTAQQADGSQAASIKVESITQGIRPRSHQASSSHRGRSGELELSAHVAGVGDTSAGPNEWIAGPATPARIEGLALRWDNKPDDVELRYAVRSPGQTGTPKMVSLESFAGSRGRAQPITGLVLELSGHGASAYQLVVEGLFLSSPTVRAVGQKVVLAGPTGREPLVGLRVEIQSTDIFEAAEDSGTAAYSRTSSRSVTSSRVQSSSRSQASRSLDATPPSLGDEQASAPAPLSPKPLSGSRVRVFRSKPKQDPLA